MQTYTLLNIAIVNFIAFANQAISYADLWETDWGNPRGT